jgi:putative membrane protein
MELILSDHDRNKLDERITEVEGRTKAQIVLTVINHSDNYAELPWKAFALGSSVAGLLVFILDSLWNYWTSHTMVLIAVAATLASGAVFALLAVFVSGFARFFLSNHSAEAEVRQYAESLFLTRELFATRERTGLMLLVSLFERKVFLLPDKGLSNRLTGEIIQDIIASMTPLLAHNQVTLALENGLEQLSRVLETSAQVGPAGATGDNELPDQIIEEKGP